MEKNDKAKAIKTLDSAIATMEKARDEAKEAIKVLKKVRDDLQGQTKLSA